MKKQISVTVNGVTHQNEVEPRLLLVQYIRDVLNLTGTHVGCETSLVRRMHRDGGRPGREELHHAGGAGRRIHGDHH